MHFVRAFIKFHIRVIWFSWAFNSQPIIDIHLWSKFLKLFFFLYLVFQNISGTIYTIQIFCRYHKHCLWLLQKIFRIFNITVIWDVGSLKLGYSVSNENYFIASYPFFIWETVYFHISSPLLFNTSFRIRN